MKARDLKSFLVTRARTKISCIIIELCQHWRQQRIYCNALPTIIDGPQKRSLINLKIFSPKNVPSVFPCIQIFSACVEFLLFMISST